MSVNENKETIIDSKENNEKEEVETTEETEEESTEEETESEEKDSEEEGEEEKPTETLDQKRARLQRQLKQVNKKLGITDEEKPRQKTSKKSEDFDYGQKAFLTANGIKSKEEREFTQKIAKQTGLELEDLIEDDYFQSKLSDFREKTNTKNARPTGSGRSNKAYIDSVEYWISKKELPPASEVELRRKVVNARLKKEGAKGVFYNS